MRRALPLLVVLVVHGCYCSHERDGQDAAPALEAGADARDPIDATEAHDAFEPLPEGPVWYPVDASAFAVAYERCETRESETLVLRVTFAVSGCDEPGNVRWSIDADAKEIHLAPFVWHPVGVPPCPSTTREVTRDVALRGARLGVGSWSVVSPDGTRLEIVVTPGPPELTCSACRVEGETCIDDGECAATAQCVPVRGDIACEARCASSCQPFDEREGAQDIACSRRLGAPRACVEDPNLGWICVAIGTGCDACRDGMGCDGAVCDWIVTPWPEPCATDADCPDGRSCVQLTDGTGRTCFVRCRGDHPCPLGEQCGPSDLVCPTPKI